MKLLVLFMIAVAAFAAPQRYSLSDPRGPGLIVQGEKAAKTVVEPSVGAEISSDQGYSEAVEDDFSVDSDFAQQTVETNHVIKDDQNAVPVSSSSVQSSREFHAGCQKGEVRHVDGSCVVPEITRKLFLVSVPKQEKQRSDALPELPPPKVDHNILFVHLPEGGVGPEPIVVPPPRQENIIYVLNKQNEQAQRVIEVPAHPPSEPEIYFVNYAEGDNPTLPGGFDLHSALGSAAATNGQVLGNTGLLVNKAVDGDFSVEVADIEVEFDGHPVPLVTESDVNPEVSNVGDNAEFSQGIIKSDNHSSLYKTL